MNSIKTIGIEIWDWFLVSVLVPFVVPLFLAFFWYLFYEPIDVFGLMTLLYNNGVYVFWMLMVLISLFQDYRKVPIAYNLFFWLVLGFCFISTSIIFWSFLGFIPNTNIEPSVTVMLLLLFPAFLLKFHIVRKKYSKIKNKSYEYI